MILCCGEALIDMVPTTGAQGRRSFAPHAGGAIFNTAIALGRLEVPVQFLSGISTDLFGDQLVRELDASNVKTDLLMRFNRPTTLAFVELTEGQAAYTFYDENSAGRMLTANDLPSIPPQIDALYFGGISLCSDPAATAYETLALRHAADTLMMIDPNIRASFIEDEEIYRARLNRMIAMADIVKISDEDLDWMYPKTTDITAKITHLQQVVAGLVILTKGGDGAAAYMRGRETLNIPAPRVQVVDTVGAGDTFNAGFLAQLHTLGLLNKTALLAISTAELTQALAFAAKVAALTVSRHGADPPFLSELSPL